MASVYDLKPRFQAMLRPLVGRLATTGVTANQVTLAALALSLGGGLALWIWPGAAVPLLVLPVILFVRMALNAIDGMLAREHDQKSDLGALLNEMGDVIADAGLYLPLAVAPGVPAAPLVLLVVSGLCSEMIGVAGQAIGASRRYDGPLGKSDRAVLFGILAVYLGLGGPTGVLLAVLLWLAVAAGLWTMVNRGRRALAEVEAK